jgi:small subunit ribosomal protein S7
MSKKFISERIQIKPDPKYPDPLTTKFINCLMWQGKKSVAQQVFYEAMEVVAKKIKETAPLEVFLTAVNNVKPMLEVRSRRVGGASYQVPMQVSPRRQQSLAIRWIIAAARSKKGKPMGDRLAGELMDAFNKEGAAITTRENVHRMAEANKAFAHFAW